jgi:hypothetical protein
MWSKAVLRKGLPGWLIARPAPWLAAIDTVTLDPYAGYARGLAEGLPHAAPLLLKGPTNDDLTVP